PYATLDFTSFPTRRSSDLIDRVRDSTLVGEDLLGAQREPDGLLGGQGKGLVHAVRMEGLGTAKDGGEGLDGHADRVDLRLLGGEDRKSTRLNSSHEWISYA